ncbi:Alpha/Beta hydrolase protein [Lactifluus subvellereus]|nr:Alpha/Beta hydrolase protein [Lactifluus subvellereus]
MVSLDDYRGNTIPPLTLWQKIKVVPLLLALPLAVVIGVFRENRGRSWRRAARIAAVRHVLRGRAWTPWELKSAARETTAQAYATWARKADAEVLTDELPEGAKLHWIGPRRMDRVLLYLHGGGYVFPARNDYFDMLASLQKEYDGAVGIAMLHYSLAPEYPFPTQLRQAFAAIEHLLDKGLSPSNIIIAGDSAGGNLALQVASQILHPHPSLPTAPTFQEPFGGALLISPWAEFGTDAPSYARNGARDLVPVCTYRLFEDAVRPGVTPALQHHLEPGRAPRGWWNGLERVYGRVLITAGEHEALIDQIQAAAAAIAEDGVGDTTAFVLPGGVHEDFVEAFGSGEGERGDDYKLAVSWVSATLRL